VFLARVVGKLVATRKDEGLHARTLLVIQPIRPDRTPSGKPLVAVDAVGAGAAEHVFYCRGREAAFPFEPEQVPSDATITGIVDSWDSGSC
jgi:microcompartment protein CcmK/EutM